MIAGLRRRIRELESRTGGEVIVLHMADGSIRQIPGTTKHYLKLAALLDSEIDDPELAALKNAVHIEESGGMFQLLSALASGPNLDEQEEKCVTIR